MIDNFEIIKPLLTFTTLNDFYFLQVIQRKKDHKQGNILGSHNSSRLIKAYYIFNIAQLDKYKAEIIALCTLFNARAGINLNIRNAKDASFEMLALLAENMKNSHFNQLHTLWNSICGIFAPNRDKRWIIDIDNINTDFPQINGFITELRPFGDKHIATIPSKTGYHVIVTPFDTTLFHMAYPKIEIHKNNPTNLYIP